MPRASGRGALLDEKTSRWSVISSLPCPADRSYKVISGDNIMGKAPHLNSLMERSGFVVSPQGLDCLQLKIIHTPEWHLLGRPGRDLSVGTPAAVSSGCFNNACGSWLGSSSSRGSGAPSSWHRSSLYVLRIILLILQTGRMLSFQMFYALVHRTTVSL